MHEKDWVKKNKTISGSLTVCRLQLLSNVIDSMFFKSETRAQCVYHRL